MTDAVFRGADAACVNFSKSRLSRSKLTFGSFPKANFDGADLLGASADFATFAGGNFVEANLRLCNARQTKFVGANLNLADLSAPDQKLCFKPALKGPAEPGVRPLNPTNTFLHADFTNAQMREAKLTKGLGKQASINYYRLLDKGENANLEAFWDNLDKRFRNVNFTSAHLENAKLVELDLTGSNFSGADLTNTDLRGANLAKADGLSIKQVFAACLDASTNLPEDWGELWIMAAIEYSAIAPRSYAYVADKCRIHDQKPPAAPN